MSSENISNLSLNPFFCSKLIHYFIQGHNGKIDFPRNYLVLPYVMYEPSRKVLYKANRNSNFYSLFIENDKSMNLGGIEKRYTMYKDLSKESVITAVNEGLIEITENGEVESNKKVDYRKEKDPNLKIFYRSSYYLGLVFSNYRTIDILIKSGVKEL
ncbi:three component ABC system middle component [Rossellomorea sp. LjRoot5]|uniref:three component ABC system middle component n=1 Tax=Rossellomorea sp. LjRoot5 TaxID=3342331 RepID=UPI003ED12CE8